MPFFTGQVSQVLVAQEFQLCLGQSGLRVSDRQLVVNVFDSEEQFTFLKGAASNHLRRKLADSPFNLRSNADLIARLGTAGTTNQDLTVGLSQYSNFYQRSKVRRFMRLGSLAG